MAQQQHAADVHLDELCPPNKRYDLMHANKKVNLEHVQCPPESKILTNIINNHSLRFSIAASSSVLWIYMAQLWHTLKEDGSKYRLRRSTRLTPPAPVPTIDKADEMIYRIHLLVRPLLSITVVRSNEAKKMWHWLMTLGILEEIDKMGDGSRESLSNRIHTNLVSSDTEKLQELTDTPHTTSSSSPHKKLAKTNRLLSLFKTKPYLPFKHYTELLQNENQVPVYVVEGLILERQKAKEETERLIAKAILQERGNIQAQISTQIENAIANVIPSQVDASIRSYMSGHILHVHPAQSQTSSVPDQQYQLYLAMKADPQLQQQDITNMWAHAMKFERILTQTALQLTIVRPRDQDDPHDDAHPEGENSAKRQKTSEYEAYVSGESSSGQVFQEEQAPSTSGNQEQDDDFDLDEPYASDE
ncbi:hypothetical protein Tco_0593005 [Tanacetum coccineum]